MLEEVVDMIKVTFEATFQTWRDRKKSQGHTVGYHPTRPFGTPKISRRFKNRASGESTCLYQLDFHTLHHDIDGNNAGIDLS